MIDPGLTHGVTPSLTPSLTKVRFAPSPTGYLHVGNARPALLNWLFARKAGGQFLLRLDDTDTQRSTAEYAEAIGYDLRWLGLDWDETWRQSDRLPRYADAADALKRTGRLYPCFESEDELRFKREQRLRRGQAPIYDRAMLKLTAEQRANAEAGGKQPYWRFLLSPGEPAWDDLVLGRRQVKLGAVSDPVLVRGDGSPLYTFTSVVDDLDSGISHVIRGEDHITNTGIQLDILAALAEAERAPLPRIGFAHLPLLLDDDGDKLSKRTGGLSLRRLRTDGMEPAAITAYLATLGSSQPSVPASLDELVAGFDLRRFGHAAARFDIAQLQGLNRRVLHDTSFDDLAARLPQGATEAFWVAVRGNIDLLSEARGWWDVVAGSIVPPVVEGEREFLRAAAETLPEEPWDSEVWDRWIAALKAASGRKGKALFLPLRLALTGEEHGPELRALLPLIGRTRTLERLQLAA